jgi:aminopeptidase N
MDRELAYRIARAAALAVACATGIFSWTGAAAEARFSFAGTPGRLPKDVVPEHYALRIVPAAAGDRFDATADIDIEVRNPVAAIVLNAAELSFRSARLRDAAGQEMALRAVVDPAHETAALEPPAGAIAPGRYRLAIDYAGAIGLHPQGLYRIAYRQRERGRLVDKVMLATHMEPVHARRLFPGWDEPVFRATFEITAVVAPALTVVSNMPQARSSRRPDGRKEVVFARSPAMASYLVALFVGEMDRVEDEVDGVRLGVYTAKGKLARARVAMQATKEIVRHYNDYFGERYALPKLDQVALPGGTGGAMENWGAIAYNEAAFLYAPATDSLRKRQLVYGIVAHEIAHQWFGNLVTMAWWDNLWLNEGFASWMASRTVRRFHPEWKMELREALAKDRALADDAKRTTHPIQTPVENDMRALDVFDAITYTKGAALLGMLEGYLGEPVFRDGVRRYIRAHRGSSATTADFWFHLSAASGRDIAELAAGWTEQPGYPVVKVSPRCAGGTETVTLTQERFTLNDPNAQALAWKIPVILADSSGGRHAVLLDQPIQLSIGRCRGFLVANAGDAGYFRVQYDDASLGRLAAALPLLDVADRLRLLSDTFAMVQAGRLDVTRYFVLAESLPGEADRSVWDQVISALGFVRDLMDDPADAEVLQAYIARLLQRPFARVGWDHRPKESEDTGLLRRSLIDALGRADDPDVVQEAKARFAERRTKPIDPAIRPAVLNVVGRHADEADFDALLAMMRSATDVADRWEAEDALRRVRNPRLVERLMGFLFTTRTLPPDEAVFNLARAGADSGQKDLAWQFVLDRLPAILAKTSARGRVHVLPRAAMPFNDAVRADGLLALQRANLDATALYEAEKAAEWIRLKSAVRTRESRRAVAWAKSRLGAAEQSRLGAPAQAAPR